MHNYALIISAGVKGCSGIKVLRRRVSDRVQEKVTQRKRKDKCPGRAGSVEFYLTKYFSQLGKSLIAST